MTPPFHGNLPGVPVTPDVVAFCADLLAYDDRARELGAPVLTQAGVRYILRLTLASSAAAALTSDAHSATKGRVPVPRWDADERRLWLGDTLLKEFRQPAPNQIALLDAFQANSWGRRHLSNPLRRDPGETEAEAYARLHATIKNLNRGLPPGTIHFRGDGSGYGVWWESCSGEPPRLWKDGDGLDA